MTKVAAMNFFAALPGRVTLDKRLNGLHFRILATVAGHDRMGRNGQCCWLGRDKLAIRVSCNPANLSTAVAELTAWGYLEAVQSQEDKRRKGLRIVYSMEEDRAGIGASRRENALPNGNLTAESRLPIGNAISGDRLPKSGITDAEHAENIVQLLKDNEYLPSGNIFSKTKNISQSQHIPQKRAYGAATHGSLAKLLGNEGWEILSSMSDDDRKFLERKYSDGVLTQDDLFEARNAFRQQRSA